MKKTVSLLLTFLFLLGAFCIPGSAADTGNTFRPVLRFVVCSDTHVQDPSDTNANNIGAMMRLAYAEAEKDPYYQALDALLVCGDLTDNGTKAQFDKFKAAVDGSLREGTRFLGVTARAHDGFTMPYAEMRAYYTELTGVPADFHTVIGGYHFIGVSGSDDPDGYYAHYNDPGQAAWLQEQLAAAVAEDPDRPVFVIQHEHVRGTVYGSNEEGWGVTYLSDVLRQYPQAVDFSGHSHYPLNDPRSLWQGEFTAIGTGAIYYPETWVNGTYHPEGYNAYPTCWIVEADANSRLRLRGMDVTAGACLCEYVLDNPADPANRDYTPQKREAASRPPVFSDGAAIVPSKDGADCVLRVPAAASEDGMPVVLYRAYAVDENGETAADAWKMPRYYAAGEQHEIALRLTDLPNGVYTLRVTAETAYGVTSAPLEILCEVSDGGVAIQPPGQPEEPETEPTTEPTTEPATEPDNGGGVKLNFWQRILDFFKNVMAFFRRLFGLAG